MKEYYAFRIAKNCEKYLNGYITFDEIETHDSDDYKRYFEFNKRECNKFWFIYDLDKKNYKLNIMNQILSQAHNHKKDAVSLHIHEIEIKNFDSKRLANDFVNKMLNWILEDPKRINQFNNESKISIMRQMNRITAFEYVYSIMINGYKEMWITDTEKAFIKSLMLMNYENKYWEKACEKINKYQEKIIKKLECML